MTPFKPASLVLAALLASVTASVRAQSTAFTYQGRLRDNTVPAVGVFDLRFALYNAPAGGSQVGSFITFEDVAVTNGLFSVILDFGVNAFTGADRWLETSLRPGTQTGAFTALNPRRTLTAAPYALYAPNAGTAATAASVPAANLTGIVPLARLPGAVVTNNSANLTLQGAFSGNGGGLAAVNADLLDSQHGAFYRNAANLTDGTLSDARLSANVALLNSNQVFNGSNAFAGSSLFAGAAQMTNTGNVIVGTHAGNGAGLSNLTAAYISGTAPMATNFSGSLAGDVTGTQGSTVVATVGGLTAANVASGASLANAAGSANTANSIVRRDASGNFAAGTVTGAFNGNGAGLASVNAELLDGQHGAFYQNAANLTAGTLSDTRLSANVALLNSNQVFNGSNLFAGATRMTNAGNLIVGTHAGDGAGLSNLTAVNLTGIAPMATNFSGALAGDVTGTQGNTVVASVGGLTAANVASGAILANAAATANTANTIVKRDGSGNFAAGTVTGTFSGNGAGLSSVNGDLLDGQHGAFYQNAGNLTAGTIADARLSANATSGINAANAATAANTANTVVKRDGSGNFAAGTVTGTFSGDGSGLTNISAANIIGGSQALLPSGTMVASSVANDAALLGSGYRTAMTVPAPAWVNGAASNAPSARTRHTAVWDGQRLIIWGGKITAGPSYATSSAMYHPNSDLWETISSIDAPAPRANHTAVWSDTEMIVWGGDGSAGWLNNGARFSPDEQKWRPISSAATPAGRSGHIAVWTGARMVIWGGQNASGLLSDGALYDPAANSWTVLTLPNPPAARARATAVWAGDRLIIWGGDGSAGVLNNGAQLLCGNGVPTEWRPLSSANAPAARRGHSAVWTGTNMIVWGGEAGGVPAAGAAAYDPAADSWAGLASVGAPAARFNHAAVWTGQEMLIVGGSTSATELASGSAFNPDSALWRPLSSTGAPQARTEATASWTGTEILVFGGRAQGQYLSALQRLVPQPVWYLYRKL